MKKLRTISFIVMALALAACNEKVSPELQDASVVTPPTADSDQDSFTFRVTTENDPVLEFMLHKTGNSFKPDPLLTSDDCEVTKRVSTFKRSEFGKSQYDMVDPTDEDELYTLNDITCYLEAEELGLYIEGLKLKVEATPGACTFVRYSPYSYYNRMPGNSSATYKKVSCAENTDSTHVNLAFTVPADIQYGAASAADCDEYLIDSRKASDGTTNIPIVAADRTVFRVDSDDETAELETEEQLCRFNYETLGQEQCDVGEITINDHLVTYNTTAAELDAEEFAENAATLSNTLYATYTDAVDGDAAGPDDGTTTLTGTERDAIQATLEYTNEFNTERTNRLAATIATFTSKTVTKRTVNCGGKISNCLEGPIKAHSSISSPAGGLITTPISSTTSYSETYSYPSLDPERDGTYVYANFRRELANSNLAYPINLEDNSDYTDFAALLYMSAFDPVGADAEIFEPRVLDRYTSNRSYILAPSTNLVTSVAWELQSLEGNKYGARPYAAEAFLGIGTYKGASNKINPFYQFECLDNARETTARIRVMVRDWDRIIPADTSTTELVSDISYGELDAYQDNTYYTTFNTYEDQIYNDYFDWDDFLRMDRTTPGPVFTPVNGFFSPSSFPNEDLSAN